jgi:hypothetical protein
MAPLLGPGARDERDRSSHLLYQFGPLPPFGPVHAILVQKAAMAIAGGD